MSKSYIVGVRTGSYTDKKTGELVDFVELQLVKKLATCIGHATEQIYINSGSPLYGFLLGEVGKKVSGFGDLIGRYVTIERSTKGFVTDVELGDKKPDDVIFGF